MSDARPRWWRREIHEDRRPFLILRNRIKAGLRDFFADQNFVEVEGGILQVSPGNEAHLHAFATALLDAQGGTRKRYLHTSPEFACKKLLAAGEQRIFDFARVFRNRERSTTHHPEFTMLEWYRAREPYEALMEDAQAILALAARIAGRDAFVFRGIGCDPFAPPERLSVSDAFRIHAGIDLLATLREDGSTDRDRLAAQARAQGHRVADDDQWSDIFSGLLVERIEPHLGAGRSTILYEYPAAEAALSRRTPHDTRLAERFELYACGVELANAFGELTDPAEQRRRFETEMREKQRIYGEAYPIDEDFLAALASMPAASGAALGFDRLVMLATGAIRIDQVIWTPVDLEPN
jgi:elongation factor P--(R)-beta-lysine ligase